MDEKTLLIDSIVNTLAENTDVKTATQFIKYAKKSIDDGSPMLKRFGAQTLNDLSEEQKDLLCRTVAEEFKALLQQDNPDIQ